MPMRLTTKPAAASVAAASLILLLLDLTWPGHGVWLLVVGVLLALTSAALWYQDRLAAQARDAAGGRLPPAVSVGVYGLSGAAFERARPASDGVALSLACAVVAVVSILLFIGGALGSAEPAAPETATTLQPDVTAIDRSRDGEPAIQPTAPLQPPQSSAPTVAPPANTQAAGQPTGSAGTSATETGQPRAAVRPIVVAAPRPASAVEEDAEQEDVALPRSAATFEYVVEDGDTLYEIAERYGSTVETLLELNQLDSFSFIHPGDRLFIPHERDDEQ